MGSTRVCDKSVTITVTTMTQLSRAECLPCAGPKSGFMDTSLFNSNGKGDVICCPTHWDTLESEGGSLNDTSLPLGLLDKLTPPCHGLAQMLPPPSAF